MAGNIKSIQRADTFKRDFKRLDPQLQSEVIHAIEDLLSNPIPTSRRFHTIDRTRPKVYSIDVTGNKSHKISFQIDGETATLRRVGTHKEIDRSW
jgi:mRNA-degrading endonuclease YafQ of YafQ-DinJ toxin-antitoxin module